MSSTRYSRRAGENDFVWTESIVAPQELQTFGSSKMTVSNNPMFLLLLRRLQVSLQLREPGGTGFGKASYATPDVLR